MNDDRMNPMRDDERDRIADVLDRLTGEMDSDEAARFDREVSGDATLAGEVEALSEVIRRLESLPPEVVQPPSPPALDRAVFGAVRDGGRRATGKRRGFRLPWSSPEFGWTRALAAGLAALALFVAGAVVGTNFGGEDSSPQVARQLALSEFGPEAPAGAAGEVSLVSSGSDRLKLSVSGLDETGPREFYELWLLGAEGELVSLGSFRVDPEGRSDIEVPVPVDPDRYRYFDVSIQPENGSPEHSGRSVLRGLTRS